MNKLVYGLSADYYCDEAVYKTALQNIFYRSWIFAGHVSELANSGDYKCFAVGEQQCFLLRGKDNIIRAFYNVCRHRGHILLPPDSAGQLKEVLVCPYHAWAYELNGELRAAPASKKVKDFDKADIRLSSIICEDFLGFIFVNLDSAAKPMDEVYEGVRQSILSSCPDIEKRCFAESHAAEEHCNWLIAVENYNECYHCGFVHKDFSSGVVDTKSYDIRPFGKGYCLRHGAEAAAGDGAWYDGEGGEGGEGYASFYLFPSFSLQIYPSQLVNSYHWSPLSVGNTRVHRSWYSNDGKVDDMLAEVIRLDKETTFAEDLQLVKGVQAGLRSRGYVAGPLIINEDFGINSEHSIMALHNWVREFLN